MILFKKAFNFYHQTAALLIVLVVLTGSIFFVLIGGQQEPKGSVQIVPPSAPTWTGETISSIQDTGSCDVANSSIDSIEQEVVNLINAYRTQNGLLALSIAGSLNRMATWTAEDLPGDSNFSDHIDTQGRLPDGRFSSCEVLNWQAENLAAGQSTAQTVFDAWNNSLGHNANILDPKATQIGIARHYASNSQYKWYWVTEFSRGGNAGGGGPGGGGGSNVSQPVLQSATPISCGQDGKWIVRFIWTPARINGNYPEQQFIDIKFDDGTPFGEGNFVRSEPLSGTHSSYDLPGIEPNKPHRWRVNGLYQGNWYGFEREATFATGSCTSAPPSPTPTNTPTPTQPPGGGGDTPVGGPGVCQAACKAYNPNYCSDGSPPTSSQTCRCIYCGPTATRTPTPTSTPTRTPTPTVSPSPSPGASPSAPRNVVMLLEINIPGVGVNDAAGENNNPIRNNIQVEVEISELDGRVIKNAKGTLPVSITPSKITYRGTITLGTEAEIDPGRGYETKTRARTSNSLWKNIGFAQIENKVTLVTGDVNQDNVLDLTDYNMLLSCYGSAKCSEKEKSDLNVDGNVEESDLNIFYSGLAKRTGD